MPQLWQEEGVYIASCQRNSTSCRGYSTSHGGTRFEAKACNIAIGSTIGANGGDALRRI